ncbi:MAG: alpha/beta hydrolase [Prochloraceae cyanobacterium]|nr:alpha/beta hydrolase [Prochloraceae cyanobacterium]
MPVRQTLKLANLEISYLEWNRGKQPLMLLHGLADCALVWSSLADSLALNYHVIAPDLRGHGESSKPETGYTFEQAIADLEALMDSLGWVDTHVVAHSWSAKLLAIWATKHPQRFRSLILVDPFFISTIPSFFEITFPILYRVLPFLQAMGPFSTYEEAEKLARSLKQYRGWSQLQQQAFQAGMEQKPDGSWGSKFTVAARDEIFAEVMKVEGLTQPIEIPTLFIKPKQGLNRTQWQLKPYKTYLKNLSISEVPGNHWPFLVEPDAFNHTVKSFLTS